MSNTICPICQKQLRLDEPIIECPICRMEHHPECWQANNGCGNPDCGKPKEPKFVPQPMPQEVFGHTEPEETPKDSEFDRYLETERKKKRAVARGIIIGFCAIVVIILLIVGIGNMKPIRYDRAMDDYYNKNYYDAQMVFQDLGGYKESREMEERCQQARYDVAMNYYEAEMYQNAAECFLGLGSFRDSQDLALVSQVKYELTVIEDYSSAIRRLEAAKLFEYANELRYSYVQAHFDNKNLDTFEYMKTLRNDRYADSEKLYEELYGWHVEITGINSSEDDRWTTETSIKLGKPLLFHFTVSGGEPGAEIRLGVNFITPNGYSNQHIFTAGSTDGYIGWFGWKDGLYAKGAKGYVMVEFYDTANPSEEMAYGSVYCS